MFEIVFLPFSDLCHMLFIDTHCHLYLKEFDTDRAAVIERAQKEGVKRFYLPAIDKEVLPNILQLEADYKGTCFAMMGLHPCSVKENYEEELQIVEEWLNKRPFAAVGEIGLDFYWDKTFIKQQYHAFEQQVDWAVACHIPIVIHSRNATQECIEVVKKKKTTGLKGVFHCFGGTIQEAHQIIELGFYLGIGGVVTYKNSGLNKVLEHISPKHLVLETDAPYLSPVPHRGKRNESSYLTYVAASLAAIKGMSLEEVASITTANAQNLFGS
jgi:TatD DNase family protein